MGECRVFQCFTESILNVCVHRGAQGYTTPLCVCVICFFDEFVCDGGLSWSVGEWVAVRGGPVCGVLYCAIVNVTVVC